MLSHWGIVFQKYKFWGYTSIQSLTLCYSSGIVNTNTSGEMEWDAGGGNPLTGSISSV